MTMKDFLTASSGVGLRLAVLVIVSSSIFVIVRHFHNVSFHFLLKNQSIKDYNHKMIRNLAGVNLKDSIDFGKAKKLAQDLLGLIRARYQLDEPIGRHFFNTANNIGNNHWEILKYKYAVKMMDEGSSFLMIFGGSSVTAGHDNYYNQSYPYIIKKRMGPIFEAIGVELVVHNIAQGANNCIPYVFCYESMGGFDHDVLGWEQSYNCGRDEPVFELTSRYGAWSKNKGLTYFSASGAWSPSDCPMSQDAVPYCSEDWTPEKANLKRWEPSKQDIQDEKALISKYYFAKASSQRFSSWIQDRDKSSVHGFNVWEENGLCETKDKKTGADVKGCNGIDAAQQCKMKFMTKEASIFGSDDGRGAGWHPPRAFHMLRGEAFSWLYTIALLDSLMMVEEDIKTSPKADLLVAYRKKLEQVYPVSITPKKCMNLHCDKRPICHTDYQPHYEKSLNLSELVVGNHSWTYDAAELNDWSHKYGYLDAKPIYLAEGEAQGEIHVKITIGKSDFALFCGTVKDSLRHVVFYLDPNVKVEDWSKYQPSNQRTEWKHRKYLAGECKYLLSLPPGNHVVSIKPHKTPSHKHVTGLTHVVLWP